MRQAAVAVSSGKTESNQEKQRHLQTFKDNANQNIDLSNMSQHAGPSKRTTLG